MKKNILAIALLTITSVATAQTGNEIKNKEYYSDYINTYCNIAIREMADYGIPASITLAQGILESGVGKSRLAMEANNHFGIKCHNDWTGETITHDDDKRKECFRKYDNAEESFIDHSQFLRNKSRYSFLFELDRKDYKGWAKGLKQAGYATDKSYATRLINLIESLELYKFDNMAAGMQLPPKTEPVKDNTQGLKYVIAQEGETYFTIAKKYNLPFDVIYSYNDVEKTARQPSVGDKVYISAKNSKCAGCPSHTVKEGESMFSISQEYGIKIHDLYDINKMPYDSTPKVGQILRLY